MEVTITPDNATNKNVSWSSENEDVARVDDVITITFDSEDVTITNNEGNNQYVFEENGDFTFEYTDAEGNTYHETAIVN